jgi:hypothetical protein
MRISKRFSIPLAAALLAAATGAGAGTGETKANPGWEKMKTLVGSWDGQKGDQTVSVTYTLVSNGMSLMESLNGEHDMNMITMYAPDGDAIVATHYCALGNQPRMRAAASGDPSRLDFQFLDATNVHGDEHVMRGLVVTFQDADHFRQSWTSRAEGKDQTSEFVYMRRK